MAEVVAAAKPHSAKTVSAAARIFASFCRRLRPMARFI
jgi:hypothetical protein